MRGEELIRERKKEEAVARIVSWDFSHLAGRYIEETDLPWDYRSVAAGSLTADMKLLDIDTRRRRIFTHVEPSVRADRRDRKPDSSSPDRRKEKNAIKFNNADSIK